MDMMTKLPIIVFLIMVLLGVLILKAGISGMVVSETCCDSPDCEEIPALCSSGETSEALDQPYFTANVLMIYLGVALVIKAGALYTFLNKKKKK